MDNKRKHLEKPLSAAKRDEVLLRAAREDIALKKQHMSSMEKNQNALIEMAKSMSASLNTLGRSVSDGLGLLAMALNPNVMQMANNSFGNINNPPPPINQHGTQGFYGNLQNYQHTPHMPHNANQEQQFLYGNSSGMPTRNNPDETDGRQAHSRFQMRSMNDMPSSNGKTYEQL